MPSLQSPDWLILPDGGFIAVSQIQGCLPLPPLFLPSAVAVAKPSWDMQIIFNAGERHIMSFATMEARDVAMKQLWALINGHE